MDCCHSGTGLDLPFEWRSGRGWREETNPFHCPSDVQLFSGCQDDGTSSDAAAFYGASGGAMTTAFCDVLRRDPSPTYPELLDRLHQQLRHGGFRQRPALTSSQCFDPERPFLLTDAVPNLNPHLGRTVRRRFEPKARPMSGPLADMLGIGIGLVGGLLAGELAGGVLAGILGGA
mmetsp:Transcript_79070/g.239870  ORF Transcript_79070/g.239870 Transcript_79070/m.239870 type:complete len:175 (-) Transcript_79070:6-530(-)